MVNEQKGPDEPSMQNDEGSRRGKKKGNPVVAP